MFRDDDIKRFFELMREFADEGADYGNIMEKMNRISSIFPGNLSFGGVKIEGDSIIFFGNRPPEEIMKHLSELLGDDILSQPPIVYKQEKKSLIIKSTIDAIKENGQYRVVAELGSLYSPECEHKVKFYHGGLKLEQKCENMQLSENIDLREELKDGYYDGRFSVLRDDSGREEFRITNGMLEVLVKKV